MEELNLSSEMEKYYSDLFSCCGQNEKISTLKATEMFRSANLSNDIIIQIMSLASIPHSSLLVTRKQFYSCLKLIAAHQNQIQLREEIITSSTLNLPLPRFSWTDSPETQQPIVTTTNLSSNSNEPINGLDDIENREWRETRSFLIDNDDRESRNDGGDPSTDSEVEQNDFGTGDGPHRLRATSPETWSTASDSPTPTNSVAERPWAKDTLWQGLLCEEQRQLLGTEEESSDRHSSDDDNDVDIETIYQITPEQREYYTKQFRSVQIDPNGLVAGHIARIFFEKSRIPVEELRHIWQLCDVTRDGALSLGEFTAAMHLVVLRRNNIPLPSQLPQCLLNTVVSQTTTAQHNPPEADLLNLGADDDARSTIKVQHPTSLIQQTSKSGSTSSSNSNNSRIQINSSPPIRDNSVVIVTPPTVIAVVGPSSVTSTANSITTIPSSTKVVIEQQPEWNQKNKDWSTNKPNWTKFPESPTSNVSSPGPKPVNFDMQRTAQAVVSDPQILHPVPLRVTPVGPEIVDDESSRNYRKSDNLVYDNGVVVINTSSTTLISRDVDSSPKQSTQMQHRDSLQNDIRPIQRPQPKKIPSKNFFPPPPIKREPSFGSNNVTIINSTANDVVENNIGGVILSSKKEPPPLPPPRPHRHARSSSLDLNKLKLNAPVPPEVPPRISPQTSVENSVPAVVNDSFADFAHFPDEKSEVDSLSKTLQLDSSGNVLPNSRTLITSSGLQSSQRTSAFEVYRKPGSRNSQSPELSNVTTTATTSRTVNDQQHDKRVSIMNESLRHISFKQDKNLFDVLKHYKEQNSLLLRLCNDLSEELMEVQQKKEEVRNRIEQNDDEGKATNV